MYLVANILHMKVAFLGKGGSGKSTLASGFVRYALSRNDTVLAIDADHNMDLTYALGIDSPHLFLGTEPSLIKKYLGMPETASFRDVARAAQDKKVRFTIAPHDPFTDSLVHTVSENLYVLTAGPHTDIVRSGEHCSHSLAAPLKVYLPLLTLQKGQCAVIDERAGTDPVATGILSGVDMAYIVVEPTVQSARVAGQIAHELAIAGIRHTCVINKYQGDNSLLTTLPAPIAAYVPFTNCPAEEYLRELYELARM